MLCTVQALWWDGTVTVLTCAKQVKIRMCQLWSSRMMHLLIQWQVDFLLLYAQVIIHRQLQKLHHQ